MTTKAPSFAAFLEYFKEQELPVTLTEEALTAFQQFNDPLPMSFITAYLLGEDMELDEYTEIVPCFMIPDTHDFHAVVCWKGELMKYQYFLVTFDKKGNVIASAVIAGLASDGNSVVRSIATIESDWTVHVIEGEQGVSEEVYSPKSSRAFQMELLATGEITMLEE